MSIRQAVILGGILLTLASTGCCRWCDRWCPQHQQPPVAQAPMYYAPQAAVAAPVPVQVAQPAANCCVPCCVPCQASPVGAPQPVPVYPKTNTWQKQYYTDPGCYCGP